MMWPSGCTLAAIPGANANNGPFRMLAKTLYGFEPILAKELRNLGAGNVKEGVRNVSFDGDLLQATLNSSRALGDLSVRVRGHDVLVVKCLELP